MTRFFDVRTNGRIIVMLNLWKNQWEAVSVVRSARQRENKELTHNSSPAVSSEPSGLLSILTAERRPLLERMWQLYQHDLSEFRGTLPNQNGLFPSGRLPLYFDDLDRRAYVVSWNGAPAGFAFIRGVTSEVRVMGEFFIVRAVRRQRVGQQVVLDLFRRYPGQWEIPFQEENPGAARFWRRIATMTVGDNWTEERRPVPGKPHIPHDVWLTLVAPSNESYTAR